MKTWSLSVGSLALALVSTCIALEDCAALRAEVESLRARTRELEEQVVRLKGELSTQQDARIEREREFLRYTQGIAQLHSLATEAMPSFQPRVSEGDRPKILDLSRDPLTESASAPIPGADLGADGRGLDPQSPSPPAPQASPSAERARDHAIFLALRTLLAAEQVTSLDLLESGRLHGEWVGPVVLRVLDDRGRPLGALAADRLRLEGSRAARMVTLVLEQGYERRAGELIPFVGGPIDASGRGGVRRIALSECDPAPWIESVPELFGPLDRERDIDDGKHDLGRLRASLNQLLWNEAASGWYRVQGIGGVQGQVLRDVALDRLDKDGHVERRYFADRLAVLRERPGLQLLLEGGSQVRNDQRAPFLDGRCRIFLPRADAAAWERAGIPGLAPAAEPPDAGAK